MDETFDSVLVGIRCLRCHGACKVKIALTDGMEYLPLDDEQRGIIAECSQCGGTGFIGKWIPVSAFLDGLKQADHS